MEYQLLKRISLSLKTIKERKMMKRVLLCLFLVSYLVGYSQTTVWSDDFETTAANWDLTTTSGTNGAFANVWLIGDGEGGGIAPPNCGVAGNGNKTLFISCNPTGPACSTLNPSGRAKYNDGGIAAVDATTNIRAALITPIVTTGMTNLTLNFNWMGIGQPTGDYAELEYSIDGGVNWVSFWTQSQTTACSGAAEWKAETVTLPTDCENQADLRIAFNWHNNSDGTATDPSIAIDQMEITTATTPPVGQPEASFTTPNLTICVGDCIKFADLSTGTNISAWNWTFNGADTPTSTSQNPNNICYNTAGTYNIILEITDDNGTDDTTISITVADCSVPNADFTTASFAICAGDCISFTDASTGTNISAWNWTFNGAATAGSTAQNPTNICYNNPGTYDVILTITDDNGTNTKTYQIQVDDCSAPTAPPTAAFVADTLVVCQGDCISFTDKSLGSPDTWFWQFTGANVTSSTMQNPTHICYNSSGTFDVTLTVTNANGTDNITNPVVVLPAPSIDAIGDTTIKIGGVAVLEAIPNEPGFLFWDPATNLDCDTCLIVNATPYITTTYYPSLIGANGCTGRDTVLVTVKFEEIVEVPSAFSPNGDGVNDSLHVLGIGITSIDFRIYNRYGQLVYSSTNINKGWDGTFNGEPLNQGVFVYTLKYTLINNQSNEKSGNVTLIK